MPLFFCLLVDVVFQELLLVQLEQRVELEQFVCRLLLPHPFLPLPSLLPLFLVVRSLPALRRRFEGLL
jgi:hypothetical protein